MTTHRDLVPGVSAVADVLALWGDDGWLTPPLHPLVAALAPTVGQVVTVQVDIAPTGPGLAPLYDVLSSDLGGRFVVIAGAEEAPGAVWGEILSLAARQRGAAGVLVDGWARDVRDVTALALPLYARGERVAGPGGRAHVVAVGGEVQVAGVKIGAADCVVADASGCARVRAEAVDDVLAAAARYARSERQVVEALAGGETLDRAYRFKKSVTDELRR